MDDNRQRCFENEKQPRTINNQLNRLQRNKKINRMNIFYEIAKGRYEERMQLITALIKSGKSLEDADAETEQYMCNRYGKYWRTGMPPNYFSKPQHKRKSFIQRIKDFFGHRE